MNVSEVMTKQVECLQENETLYNAAVKMRVADTGVLPVTTADGRIQGILTDRDIVTRAVAEGKDPRLTSAAAVMTKDPVTCRADCSIERAVELMQAKQIRRLVITEQDNRHVVGILSLGDIAVRGHESQLVSEATEVVCQPS